MTSTTHPPRLVSGISTVEQFAQQLDLLVLLLQTSNEMPELAEPALLAEMVGALQSGATAIGGLPGVPELLRSWRMALLDLARGGGRFDGNDLVPTTLWFMALQEHVGGRLDAEGRAMLAQLPDGIRWLPRLSPAFAQGIARRLHAQTQTSEADAARAQNESQPLASAMPERTSADDAIGEDAADDASAAPDIAASATDTSIVFDAEAAIAEHTDATADALTETGTPVAFLPDADAMAFDPFAAPAADDTALFASAGDDAVTAADDVAPAAIESAAIDPPFLSNADDTPLLADTHNDSTADTTDTATDALDSDAFAFEIGDVADDDTAPDSARGQDTGPIWIGQDELDLTRQAIAEQLLPMAQAWADCVDADASNALTGELGYQMHLVENVLELIGTHALAHGMRCLREGVERGDAATGPEAVATVCNVLLATIEAPGEDSAELLIMAADGLPGLEADWADALRAEMARVSIGFDPALIAARKSLAEPEDMALSPADDVVPSVLDGMLRELPDNAERLGAAVRALAERRSFDAIDEARRVAHTIKGDANTVGVRGLAHLTHALEDILVALAKRSELLDDALSVLLIEASDCVEEMADHLLGRGPAPAGALPLYQQVLDAANALADGAMGAPTRSATDTTPVGDDAPTATESTVVAPALAEPTTAQAAAGQSLNVASSLLDELQRLAGEGMVTARQIDQQLDGLTGLHRDQRGGVRNTQDLLARLDDLVALRGAALQSAAQQAGADIDPLEMDQYNELHIISRQLLEAQADSVEFMRRITRTMAELDELRNQQEQLNRDLQRTILRTRTVPFGQISARLQRIVRQTSRQVAKPVELEIVGEDIPVDAELLERVVEPLAHLLRNAIDHGIESPAERTAAGKPETGQIAVRVGLQGDSATIEIRDDGRGLDFAAIRRRALEAGLIEGDLFAEDAQTAIDERLLTRLILLPGFSTRDTATDVSGRGIGMDVVNQRIAALRGSMQIASETGQGTRIALRLPVTRTLANVIVARGQRQVSAVVASSVERVVNFAQGECRIDADHGLQVRIEDAWLPALPIELLYDETADLSAWMTGSGIGLLAVDAEGQRRVVLVRTVDEVRSVVVKQISTWLPPIPAVRGITQLGDGGLAPVLDLDQLLQTKSARSFDTSTLALPVSAPVTRVVVADDSLSVRRALEQLMQDAGFEVAVARDGFEALAAVQAKPTHALLVDLEMPRMNGLEVTRSLRNHNETRELPVVMITSRATDRHQAMATEAGVTRMLGKPFSEDGLVTLVRELIAEAHTA